MRKIVKNNKVGIITLLGIMGLIFADFALAGGTPNLAWEKPICFIAASLSGPVAKAVSIIIFVLSGLAMAAGEASGVMKTMIMTIFGLSLALMGAQWLGFLGGSGVTSAGYSANAACTNINAL